MAHQHIRGLAVAITRGDQVVHVRGYGEAHDELPVTGQTQFRIASLRKSFTAIALLQLVEAGRFVLIALMAGMAVWSLLRLRRWSASVVNAPRWKLFLRVLWPLLPALLLPGLPRLLAMQSGAISIMSCWPAPELIVLLCVCGALGALNKGLRAINRCANAQTRGSQVRSTTS